MQLSELINQSIDKLKKAITKKQFELKTLLDQTSQLKNYNNANHMIQVYKQCIDSKQVKLMELALFDIKNIVDQYFILNEKNNDKYAIETLLEIVLSAQQEKEETVQMHMIKAIQAIMTNRQYHIHGEAVTRVFQLLINLHSVSKITVISTTSKECCQKIVACYFVQLEEYGVLSEEEVQQAQLAGPSPPPNKSKALINADLFISGVVRSMVDETVLYSERIALYEKQVQELSNQKIIDLKLQPPALRNVSNENNQFQVVGLTNEIGTKNGKFGWCVVCRKAAQSYCKDTKVPICDKGCKLQHIALQQSLQHLKNNNSELYEKDAFEILDMLCQLSLREQDNPQVGAMVIKCKALSLELIYEALAQSDIILQNKPKLIQLLKEQLFESLLKNSLSQEKPLLLFTLNIFIQLMWKVRSHFKKEVEALIENVYFKFLDSSNSSFDHKQYTLKVFNKILTKPKVVIEIFLNYDCSLGQNNLLKKILDLQCRIIQGRFSNQEFQRSISQNQEAYLKLLCLENYCGYVKCLKEFCEESDKLMDKEQKEQIEEQEDIQSQQIQSINQDPLEKQREMKLNINKAVQKFNFKPDHCIKHLIACQYMNDKDVKLFSQFLWENRDLNKDNLGEFFGNQKEFNQAVLCQYIDFMNFQGLQVDEGLRYLLEYFTLPGESQQIDRIMEKFASKYCVDNPGLYSSASAAYTLSYLLMMLQTDLHNQLNTEKMTLAQFTNLAKGINDGQNLPQEQLNGFYERIQKTPLALHAKEQAKKALEQASQFDQKKRHQMLAKEAEQGLKKWFKEHQNQDAYLYANSIEHVKYLLQQTWSAIFASISVFLEQTEDQQQIQLCFESIGIFIQLMGRFDLDDEKDTFIQFLQRYCISVPNTFKQLLGVQTLLNSAIQSGQYLRKSWKVALQLVSRLEILHSAVKKIKIDSGSKENFSNDDLANIERLFASIEYSQIDKIFNLSINLDSDSILDFIRALCELSREEINQNRTFLLSRVVEVADFNMDRIKIIWSRMWEIIREHFLEVGCHKNVDLAIYAIDQLKQLSCKFLQQPELANYHFQKEFLMPFEQIFGHSQGLTQYKTQLREYILSCMCMITNVCFNSLKSGWKNIINIINSALQEDQQQLVKLCVQITDKIMEDVNNQPVYSELYLDLIQALIKLTKNKDLQIVVNAIQQIKILVDHIAQVKKQDSKFLDTLWIPVLSSLSILYSDERVEVQQSSVNTLFQLLSSHGYNQTNEFWKMILRGVIRPLFDEIQFSKLQFNKQQNKKLATCKMTFKLFTDLVVQQITQLHSCINDLIDIYVQLILQTQDHISILCLNSLKIIVQGTCEYFTEENKSSLIEQITHLLIHCSPNDILECGNLEQSQDINNKPKLSFKFNAQECSQKQIIQERCLEILLITINQKLTNNQQELLLQIFTEQYQKCKKFNSNLYIRYHLEQWAISWNYKQRQDEDDDNSTQLSFITAEFLSAKAIVHLINDKLNFVNEIIQRILESYKNANIIEDNPLISFTKLESQIVITKTQSLFIEDIFPLLQNYIKEKIVSKWLIQLLKAGLNATINNKIYNQKLVDLLEIIIDSDDNKNNEY